MTDLDALKEDLAYLRERGDLAAALTATTAELYRLIEEVERLRVVNADLRIMVDGLEVLLDRMLACGEHRREEEP